MNMNDKLLLQQPNGDEGPLILDAVQQLDVHHWMLEPKRPMGCQFINTHNVAVSEVFNCNTNVVQTLFIMQQYTVAKILKQMMVNSNKLSVILQTNVC